MDGQMDGRTDVRMDRRMDIWKFTPVSYRTSALWGRCPKSKTKSVRLLKEISERIAGTAADSAFCRDMKFPKELLGLPLTVPFDET